MFSECPKMNTDPIWLKCYSTYTNSTRKLCKTILYGLFFYKNRDKQYSVRLIFVEKQT